MNHWSNFFEDEQVVLLGFGRPPEVLRDNKTKCLPYQSRLTIIFGNEHVSITCNSIIYPMDTIRIDIGPIRFNRQCSTQWIYYPLRSYIRQYCSIV